MATLKDARKVESFGSLCKKREAGLIDVKFLVGSIDEASFDHVANEVLRLEDAVQRGDYRVIRLSDG